MEYSGGNVGDVLECTAGRQEFCRCGGYFLEPINSDFIVRKRANSAFAHINGLHNDIVLSNIAAQF